MSTAVPRVGIIRRKRAQVGRTAAAVMAATVTRAVTPLTAAVAVVMAAAVVVMAGAPVGAEPLRAVGD